MPERFRVAVCESPAGLMAGSAQWNLLCRMVAGCSPRLLLLNEMPFGPWIAAGAEFDKQRWAQSLFAHNEGLERLEELGAAVVAGSRPRLAGKLRLNEGFAWSPADGLQGLHTKQYFPEEEGYYEARWFHAGKRNFRVASLGGLRCGFLICTELMFNEQARHYGRHGAQALLVPRAVGAESLERWLVALRMAAIVSGCFVLTSNRAGADARGQVFGGSGWIIGPTGEVLARTSADAPVVCWDLDLRQVTKAQAEYPCYVRE